MLKGFGMIVGEENGVPVYDPYQICADLDERLFWQGAWQDGLYPTSGLSAEDIAQRDRFSAAMETFRKAVGKDGRPAFASPMALSSTDATYTALDATSFAAWLDAQHFTSAPLRAYIRYCCRDDYGAEPDHVSAWAGMRYFACRRGWAARGVGDRELTWPEGNTRLSQRMGQGIASHIRTGHSLLHAQQDGGGVVALVWDHHAKALRRYRADVLILAMPQFVAHHLAPDLRADGLTYAPWVVANVASRASPPGRGRRGLGQCLGRVGSSGLCGGHASDRIGRRWADGGDVVHGAVARRTGGAAAHDADPASGMAGIVAADLLAMNPDLEGRSRASTSGDGAMR
jgi:hypothetical protein